MKNLKFLIPIAFGLMAMSCNDYEVSPLRGGEDDQDPIIITPGGNQNSGGGQGATEEMDSLRNN